MSRITPLDPAQATGTAATLFTSVKAKLGLVPNLMRVLGNAPAALQGYLQLSGALAGGALRAPVRERLALAIGEANACDYCLSAHSQLGRAAGLSAEQIVAARQGEADDPKTAAILAFALAVVEYRGAIPEEAIQQARAAGVTDAEIIEVVGHVALNTLTNYMNHVAATDIDFPRVQAGTLATA